MRCGLPLSMGRAVVSPMQKVGSAPAAAMPSMMTCESSRPYPNAICISRNSSAVMWGSLLKLSGERNTMHLVHSA